MAEKLKTFLRIKQIKNITGMSRSWIYDAIRRGEFPAQISCGARAVAWDSDEILDWQQRRITQTGKSRTSGLASDAANNVLFKSGVR